MQYPHLQNKGLLIPISEMHQNSTENTHLVAQYMTRLGIYFPPTANYFKIYGKLGDTHF